MVHSVSWISQFSVLVVLLLPGISSSHQQIQGMDAANAAPILSSKQKCTMTGGSLEVPRTAFCASRVGFVPVSKGHLGSAWAWADG